MEIFPINNKLRMSNSILDEIRAQDIYTVHSPDYCPSIPADLIRSTYTSYQQQSESQQGNLISDTLPSTHIDFFCGYESEDISSKSQQNKQFKLKRLSVGKYQNLPAVLEEDFNISHLSKETFTTLSERYESVDNSVNDLSFNLMKHEIDEFLNSSGNDSDTNDDQESWVDLSRHTTTPPLQYTSNTMSSQSVSSPDRVTPTPFGNGEEYLRLLREAQKESTQSSARVSLSSSRKDTPRDSPKSPPNSPNTEMALEPEEVQLKGMYINYYNREGDFVRVEKNVETDWIWDWSSRPDQAPPKEWHFVHPRKGVTVPGRGASLRKMMVGNSSIFSRDVLYTLLLTNVLSLLLGTGIGIWLSKKSGGSVTVSALSIN